MTPWCFTLVVKVVVEMRMTRYGMHWVGVANWQSKRFVPNFFIFRLDFKTLCPKICDFVLPIKIQISVLTSMHYSTVPLATPLRVGTTATSWNKHLPAAPRWPTCSTPHLHSGRATSPPLVKSTVQIATLHLGLHFNSVSTRLACPPRWRMHSSAECACKCLTTVTALHGHWSASTRSALGVSFHWPHNRTAPAS